MNKTITFWLGILGVLFFVIPSVLGGFQFENYSHIQQYISESYAINAPYGIYLRIFGFIPSGIFIILFSLSALKVLPKSNLLNLGLIGFAFLYGFGNILVSVFPCDVGCNKELIDPSFSQLIHTFSGALTYTFVPLSLILIGFAARSWKQGKNIMLFSFFCGIITFMFSLFISSNPTGHYIGLFQRIIEGSILIWIITFAFYIKKQI
ncbi:DUF998 domain-containing protein [Xanthomarina sp. F2636L]|uniref:DUF998 domain-containing protein n=1 Tax=Xanthomarina sp. F2636L TaxID=2996018 RepID=UPI00225E0A0C|nr:DUF998 domain-containing protein [Xanthomarina sp. F2636L]MCX7549882.1 DUF998 domain-containing protein [Xanthomarina sp. F2636L]